MSTFDTSLKMFTSQIQAKFKFNTLALSENNIREAYKGIIQLPNRESSNETELTTCSRLHLVHMITLVATSSCSNKITTRIYSSTKRKEKETSFARDETNRKR